MSDCKHLEQQLAQMEAILNLLDALRADIPPDELYGMALTGLCERPPTQLAASGRTEMIATGVSRRPAWFASVPD